MGGNIWRKFLILDNLFEFKFGRHFEFNPSETWRHTGSDDSTSVLPEDAPRHSLFLESGISVLEGTRREKHNLNIECFKIQNFHFSWL